MKAHILPSANGPMRPILTSPDASSLPEPCARAKVGKMLAETIDFVSERIDPVGERVDLVRLDVFRPMLGNHRIRKIPGLRSSIAQIVGQ